jgi:hypothetical protein
MGTDQTNLRDRICEYVTRYDWATFAELTGLGDDCTGNMEISFSTRKNVVLWGGVSQPFADALTDLLDAGTIHMHGSHVMVYLVDGAVPVMPIAKRPPKAGYKEPHWLPVSLRPGAQCANRDCPAR